MYAGSMLSKIINLIKFNVIFENKVNLIRYLSTKSPINPSNIPVKLKEEQKLIRNVGIIAHIDAGKTTTTERMLYYSGFSRVMGEVHDGDTVMDFMEQERERGITISSAAITFNWNNHQINLVDTPGHVDFTVEVERSLRVLDGAVTILDASAGVEAQTFTVWSQADTYKIPRIVYLNKMDKPRANIELCLTGIREKLRRKPLLLQEPLLNDKGQFYGIVDLINEEVLTWDQTKDGKDYTKNDLTNSHPNFDKYQRRREELIESIADLDNDIAECLISSESSATIPKNDLQSALRRITLKNSAVPVLCGSSFKNIGVQTLMDCITSYLPNPLDIDHDFLKFYSNSSCGLVFKIIHDKRLGILAFVRVYSGSFEQGQKIYNVNRETNETVSKLYLAFANDFKNVSKVNLGNIAIFTGLKDIVTGDTLVSSKSVAENARKSFSIENKVNINEVKPILAGIRVSDPVFFCSIEAPSLSYQKSLENALECLQREDPSLKLDYNSDWGQTIISGMGELHIEVIRERIKREYGVDAYLGPLQVSYRETPSFDNSETYTLNKTVSGTRQLVTIGLSLKSTPGSGTFKKLIVIPDNENNLGHLHPDSLKAIRHGIQSSLAHGPLLGFPVINLSLKLDQFQTSRSTTHAMISAATSQCLRNLLKKCELRLMEPFMKLEIAVEASYHGVILKDLNHRRSDIKDVDYRDEIRVIKAVTPLTEMKKYASHLRQLTSGKASFTMEFSHYELMSPLEQQKAISEVTGF